MSREAKRAYDSVAALYRRSLELRDDIRVSSLVSTYFSSVTHWVLSVVCNGFTPSEPSGCSPRDFCRVLAPTVVFIHFAFSLGVSVDRIVECEYLLQSECTCGKSPRE